MPLRYSANLSMLYTDVPFLERVDRAAAAGFDLVEFMFPYEAGVPALRARLEEAGLGVALFNLHAGDREAGEWGTLSNPGRRDYFRWSLAEALEATSRLGCPRLNAMFGNRVPGLEPAAQAECALENLAWAAPQAAQAGVTLLLEPLNPVDFPNAFLLSTAAGLDIVAAAAHPAVRLQYDVYHAAMTGDRLPDVLPATLPSVGHIQVADAPGRHEPGTGQIDFAVVFRTLEELGYPGVIGLEYRPLGDTDAGLAWLPRPARSTPRV
jgi:hydroxypyruvate isomerase